MSKAQMLLAKSKTRGATMVEYALVIIAIMFLAAVAFRALGKSVSNNATTGSNTLDAR